MDDERERPVAADDERPVTSDERERSVATDDERERPVAADVRERAIAEIVAAGKATRKRPSRALWLVALVVGALGAIGFIVVLLADAGEPSSRRSPTAYGLSFSSGLVVGLVAGIAVGFALARRASRSD